MRVILSRKGFDSSVQGGGSPNIIYNNKCYMIPIPEVGTDIRYDELKFENNIDYLKVMRDLNINQFTECHLDPFISKEIAPEKCQNWKFNLGQVDSAQSCLANVSPPVGKGDLFLFFGWFQKVNKGDKGYKYIPIEEYHPEGVHLIYGYLFVDEVIKINKTDKRPDWTKKHPHVIHQDFYTKKYETNENTLNTLYVAKENFKNTTIPGAGVFAYSEELILSRKGTFIDKENKEKNYTRTSWKLPDAFLGASVKFLNSSHPIHNTTIKAASRGQEFVVITDPNEKISDWAEKLITKYIKG
jgi:hypothetical protein